MVKLNILIVPATDWLRGPPQRLHHFARILGTKHNVHVLYVERPHNFRWRGETSWRMENVTLHKVPTIRAYDLTAFYVSNLGLQFFSILKILVERRIDVVIVDGLGTSSIALVLAKITRIPIIYDYCDHYPEFISLYINKNFKGRLIRFFGYLTDILNTKFSDATVAITDMLVRQCSQYSKHVFKVPNGFSLAHFRAIESKDVRSKQHITLRLGFVGSLESWVQLEMVFDAVHELNSKRKVNACLYIVGDGSKLKSFMDYSNKLKMADSVKFVGWVPYADLLEYLRMFDICVLPFDDSLISLYSMPMKIHEYAFCKKPIISRPLPEIRKVYGDSILYATTSQEYLDNVEKLISDRGFAHKLSEASFQIALNYSWENLSKDYEAILMEIVHHV